MKEYQVSWADMQDAKTYRFTPVDKKNPDTVYPTQEVQPTFNPGIRFTVENDDGWIEPVVEVVRFDDSVYQIRCTVEDLGETRRRRHESQVGQARHELKKLNALRRSFGLSEIADPDGELS